MDVCFICFVFVCRFLFLFVCFESAPFYFLYVHLFLVFPFFATVIQLILFGVFFRLFFLSRFGPLLRTRFFRSHFVPSLDTVGLIIFALSTGLFVSAVVWLLYLALEPYVRRVKEETGLLVGVPQRLIQVG